MDIHGKIREVLSETVREERDSGHRSLSEEDFLRALQRRGIIDDVMRDLHFTKVSLHFAGLLDLNLYVHLLKVGNNYLTFLCLGRKQM